MGHIKPDFTIYRVTKTNIEYCDDFVGTGHGVYDYINDGYLFDAPEGERYLVIENSSHRVYATYTVKLHKQLVTYTVKLHKQLVKG